MRIRTSAMFVALWLAFVGVATAQVSNTGTIQVVITDKDGGRLPGVTVTASAPDTITKRTVVTDAEGVATIEALAPSAQYTVTAELQGLPGSDAQPGARALGTDRGDHRHAAARRRHRSRAGHGGDAAGRHDQRDHRPGHHAAADRVAADRPQLPELPAAGAGRDAR